MSNRWPGGVITKTPVTPTGPLQNGTAPGMWSMADAAYWIKQGLWPTAGNFLAVEDVFSTWLYTGNGSTQTITNGIDLAGKGGLVWIKARSAAGSDNNLFDTNRGATNRLFTNTTDAQITTAGTLNSFSSSGFALGSQSSVNQNTTTYASWTFREAPKFFDVVTWTGNGVNGRQIAHNLGVTPGCIIYKCTSTATSWLVLHRSLPNGFSDAINLNTTDAAFSLGASFAPTATTFTMSNGVDWNQNGQTYVAYLFAHDTATNGIIQCGGYTGNGSSTGPTVTLGWEPQWVMIKNASTNGTAWVVLDDMRGMPVGANDARLLASAADAETSSGNDISPTATGFQLTTTSPEINANGATYVYIAIRRGPMRTPSLGTTVFQPVAYTADNTDNRLINTGIVTDLAIARTSNNVSTGSFYVADRLRGIASLATALTASENTDADSYMTPTAGYGNAFSAMNGFGVGNDITRQLNYGSVAAQIAYGFRRAPSFMDVVCYEGNSTARWVDHNLAAVPELMIIKQRNSTSGWSVYAAPMGNQGILELNTNGSVFIGTSAWNSTTPTATQFRLGGAVSGINVSGNTYVNYLFASCPGVSKVGSYTGTGTTQTINCGFTTGARFVMIKRTDDAGDWFVWDSARGIVAGNDPYLRFNSTSAETTVTDYIDADNTGFQISSTASAEINANGGTFIYLAIS